MPIQTHLHSFTVPTVSSFINRYSSAQRPRHTSPPPSSTSPWGTWSRMSSKIPTPTAATPVQADTSHWPSSLRPAAITVPPVTVAVPLSKVYSLEPVPAELSVEESKYILGPQVNLWTEYVAYPDHAMYMLLPRLDAISEVQWTPREQKNFEAFTARLARMEKLYDKLGYKYCTKWE